MIPDSIICSQSEIGRDGGSSSSPSLPGTPLLKLPVTEDVVTPPSPPVAGDRDVQEDAVLHARSYQVEMLEESLKQNIIVAMDTGSGKTQVAILRMQAELERSLPGTVIWFLAPTVALCYQQFKVIKSQIPGVLTKILSGNDGPDTWSTSLVWDTFLDNARIMVTTPQVLSDALLHDFVTMERLSLIVFDEAHNCVGKNPGSKVMDVYRRRKQIGLQVPAILGLTASPVMKTSADSLEAIERTLDAICKTPTKHRGELLTQVKRPEVVCLAYDPVESNSSLADSDAMKSLELARRHIHQNIRKDPYIMRKLLENTERSRAELRDNLRKSDTPSIKQLDILHRRSHTIRSELGLWASDYFIHTAITQYLDAVRKNDISYAAWDLAERQYLTDALLEIKLPDLNTYNTTHFPVTDKVVKLIEQLITCPKNTLGIIFVQETGTVSVLHRLLSLHPLTRSRFRLGTMMGISRPASRKRDVGDISREDSLLNLEKFRSGKIDLLIATNVLEEGIDVPACNLVICFDRPSNLKSFIQRRGRARMRNSQLVLLFGAGLDSRLTWEELEQAMKKQYEDEDREKHEFNELEDVIEEYAPTFSTTRGNRMDLDHAKAHLEHFCATLFSRQFVESRPYYLFQKEFSSCGTSKKPLIKATVVLPNALPVQLRRVDGARAWLSEKGACKDAAFEAYRKLYEAGLINENLLPFKDEELIQGPVSRLSEDQVSERWNPWPRVARAWTGSQDYRQLIRLSEGEHELCRFVLSMPVPIPKIHTFKVFWEQKPWTVDLMPVPGDTTISDRSGDETMALILLALGHRQTAVAQGQHVLHFHSVSSPSSPTPKITIEARGSEPFSKDQHDLALLPYLIRNIANGAPYFYEAFLPSKPAAELMKRVPSYYKRFIDEHGEEGPWLALRKWPRRRNFLHNIRQDPGSQKVSEKPYQAAWPASLCRVDSTPIMNVKFGSLIPSITHMVEIYLVAQELSETVLKELHFRDLGLLITAISASSAREATDYQRLEFLGDVLLKLLATVSVAVNHPGYPEGYLTKMRTRMVSNSTLCRSTRKAGLDKFVLTKEFTGDKWQPLDITELAIAEEDSGTRLMSTKVLADIIESLVGASFQDAGMGQPGMDNALQCLRLLIPDNKWHSLDQSRHVLLSLKATRTDLPSDLYLFEELLGYSFANKTLLVEALTHGSYNLGTSSDRSYERLEFIGDAILDYIVVAKLWERNLPQTLMSPLRAACVNADLLGFLGMEWTVAQRTGEIVDGQPVSSSVDIPFWKFMRHGSSAIGALQADVEDCHARERGPILDAMGHADTYPWALLSHLHVPKFFSDIFESVIGAIWLDSGDLGQCEAIVRRIGILPYLERILYENVDIFHPKNKLGEIAGQKTVRYEVGREEEPATALTCKVFVGDELVVEVGQGLHKDEIITKGAERAYEILKARRDAEVNKDTMVIDG